MDTSGRGRWTFDSRLTSDPEYDVATPEVVCRQLGYERVCNAGMLFGKCSPCTCLGGRWSFRCTCWANCSDAWSQLMPNIPQMLDGVNCVGNESRLVDCPHASWARTLTVMQRRSRRSGVALGIPLVTCCSSTPLPPPFPPPSPSRPCRDRWGKVMPCSEEEPPEQSFIPWVAIVGPTAGVLMICVVFGCSFWRLQREEGRLFPSA